MTISPGLGVAIMMNNYLHDVATALMASSAFALHAVMQIHSGMNDPAATRFFLRTHDRLVVLFKFSLWWIVIGGIPRTIFYTSFEWANAADKLQVPALMVKHVVMFIMVVWGVIAWRRMKRRVELLRRSMTDAL